MFWRKPKIKFLLLNENATLPTVAYNGESAAFDLYPAGEVRILPGEIKTVPFNLKMIIPKGYFVLFYNKSSIEYKHKLKLLGGVIDRGYTEALDARMKNFGTEEYSCEKHKPICQGILLPCKGLKVLKCSEKEFDEYRKESKRKEGGFGSSTK